MPSNYHRPEGGGQLSGQILFHRKHTGHAHSVDRRVQREESVAEII